MQSATKYLNGHSDVTGGVVAGSRALVAPIEKARRLVGTVMDPHPAYALGRGLKTLPLRVARHNANAHGGRRVSGRRPPRQPGLLSGAAVASGSRDREAADDRLRRHGRFDLDGGFDRAERVYDRLQIIKRAASLGGVESLISMPVLTSQWGHTDEQLQAAGVTEGCCGCRSASKTRPI